MARLPGREAVYEVADLFRQRCLIDGNSLLWPDEPVWSLENLDSFWAAFVGRPDEGSDAFVEKLRKQLEDAPSPIHKLAVDILVMYCLPISNGKMGRASKRNLITTVMSWKLGDQGENAEWLEIEKSFADGVADPGMFYMIAGRPWHVAYILKIGKEFRSRQLGRLSRITAREVADDILLEFTSGQLEIKANVAAGRHFLLHLLYPDEFESIASTHHKRKIVCAFSQEAGIDSAIDLDEALLAIRLYRENNLGPGSVWYYNPEIRSQWIDCDPNKPGPEVVVIEPPQRTQPSITTLAGKTHLDEGFLREIESLLIEKRQLIFEGPPGSGKTFVAELFARWFTGEALDDAPTQHVEIVQFHQSYGYEDFVQGIRPETNSQGQLTYNVRDGVFIELCRRAADQPNAKFVLLIDEVNRGNISRIFGELILLLEYREKRARLPYATGDNPYLTIPKNLFIIGTMNSADRSLAQVDYALRRRFYFVRFMPVENGRAIVLDRWLQDHGFDEVTRVGILTRFVSLNERVTTHLSHDFQVGHSYLMHSNVGTVDGYNRIWARAIQPLLEEYFHHHRERESILEEIRLLALGAFDTSPTVDSGDIAIDAPNDPVVE
jgi:MoxR-like ATPase